MGYHNGEYPEDIMRIQKVLVANGIKVPDEEAQDLYNKASEWGWSASWLILPEKDEDIWKMISRVPLFSIQDIRDKKYL